MDIYCEPVMCQILGPMSKKNMMTRQREERKSSILSQTEFIKSEVSGDHNLAAFCYPVAGSLVKGRKKMSFNVSLLLECERLKGDHCGDQAACPFGCPADIY